MSETLLRHHLDFVSKILYYRVMFKKNNNQKKERLITMKKKKETYTLSKKNKKTIDKFIKILSDLNKDQNKMVTSYYSFKETLTDYLKVVFSEEWKSKLNQQIAKGRY